MGAYEFVALDERGKQRKGIREADTARQIRQQRRESRWTPLEGRESLRGIHWQPAYRSFRASFPISTGLPSRRASSPGISTLFRSVWPTTPKDARYCARKWVSPSFIHFS